MIDAHIHLLPAIDDGAASLDVSVAMLRRARDLGFHTLVATPHLPGPLTDDDESRIEAALALVRTEAEPIGVTVLLGFEAALTPDLPDRLARGERSTVAGGAAVLVDLPFAGWPLHVDTTLFALQTAGYLPVLAHPERYAAVQDDPARAIQLAERGVVLQANIGSFAGIFGRRSQRAAEALLHAGAIHLVATDAHSASARYVAVPDGLARLRAAVGDAGLRRLLEEAPRAILGGSPLPEPVAAAKARRGPLSLGRVIRRIGRA